jgi:hypothetical protein
VPWPWKPRKEKGERAREGSEKRQVHEFTREWRPWHHARTPRFPGQLSRFFSRAASIDLASARPDPLLGRQGPEHGGEVPRDGEEGPRRRQRRRELALGASRRHPRRLPRRRRALGRRPEPALLRRRRRRLRLLLPLPRRCGRRRGGRRRTRVVLRLRRRRGPDRRQRRQDVARGGSHHRPETVKRAMRCVECDRGRRGEEVKTKEEEPEAVAPRCYK